MLYPLLLQLHGLTTAGEISLATLGNDHLRAALSALITLAHLISHFPSASVTHLQGNAFTLWEARPFRPQSSPIWDASQCRVPVRHTGDTELYYLRIVATPDRLK